ncbi:hypothetical protein BU16DRAFT_122460 [Lophium mytilinum]|uniref:CCHC-type domain-containing protein n=1 Tax=Lophium mytilinum TaxID=390894 RepID=A0A6A6QHL7_9PEZI|nr:hypothetical protein BU16DRAFT_122460 [Lophium mytilinum]
MAEVATAAPQVDTAEEDTAEEPVAMEEDSVRQLATPAVAMDICRATALKARSATTVSPLITFSKQLANAESLSGGEVGHLSRDCPSETSNERVCYKCKQPGHVQASCPN